jgi:hypothetical protein
MRRAFSALSFVSLLALTPACDSEDTVGDDFRSGLDVNIQMTTADGGSDDGTVVWEVVEAQVFEGPAAGGNLLLYIENNAIYTAEGVQTCHISSPFLNSSIREVTAAGDSEILFTVWNEYVFQGEIDVSKVNYGTMKELFGTQLLFQYTSYEIYLGEAKDGHRLMATNADANLVKQSDGRKLLMAALIAGECGSAGLPGYTF